MGKGSKGKRVEGQYILEFKQLLDGNYMVVLNGEEFSKRWRTGNLTIDLAGPSEKINVKDLKLYLWRHGIVQEETIGTLMAETKKLKKGNEKDIVAYVKKWGWHALEIMPVKKYLKGLVEKLRDKNTSLDEEKKYRKSLKSLNSALVSKTITKQPKLFTDIKINDFRDYYYYTCKYAELFYEDVKAFCREGCGDSFSSCSKRETCFDLLEHLFYNDMEKFCRDCPSKKIFSLCTIKDKCPNLLEHIGNISKKESVPALLHWKCSSKYAEQVLRKKFNIDGYRYDDLVRGTELAFGMD